MRFLSIRIKSAGDGVCTKVLLLVRRAVAEVAGSEEASAKRLFGCQPGTVFPGKFFPGAAEWVFRIVAVIHARLHGHLVSITWFGEGLGCEP
jgi:hypothetical protein